VKAGAARANLAVPVDAGSPVDGVDAFSPVSCGVFVIPCPAAAKVGTGDKALGMSEETPNRQRLRVATVDYEKLRWKILERDDWKCQHCGRRDQLRIHHMNRRSQLGDDSEGNLITLCTDCHRATHAYWNTRIGS
jgi:hypothetical protein